MRSIVCVWSFLTALLLTFALPAQGDDAGDVTASLEATSSVVPAGSDIGLRLTVTVHANTSIAAEILAGMRIETTINGAKGPSMISGQSSKKVAVLAGTKIERSFSIPSGQITSDPVGSVTRVTLSWPGLPGASAAVSIAPDASGLDLASFDLTKTRVMLVTNYGNMVVKFLPEKAPKHAENFIKLAKKGFYDGTRFHRVIKGFMIQGGCPNTKEGAVGAPGTGSPGYTINAEFNDVKHVKGILSMARGGDPNSAGSQFFVVHGTAPWLDGQYSAFAQLESGQDALDKIANVEVGMGGGGEQSVPRKPIHLIRAVVLPVLKKDGGE